MKLAQREAARKMREEGASIKEIAAKLGVSPGSASIWVRDIKLSEEQRAALAARTAQSNPAPANLEPVVAALGARL